MNEVTGVAKEVLVERELDDKDIDNKDIVYGIAECFNTCDLNVKVSIIKNFTELSKDIPLKYKDVIRKALKI